MQCHDGIIHHQALSFVVFLKVLIDCCVFFLYIAFLYSGVKRIFYWLSSVVCFQKWSHFVGTSGTSVTGVSSRSFLLGFVVWPVVDGAVLLSSIANAAADWLLCYCLLLMLSSITSAWSRMRERWQIETTERESGRDNQHERWGKNATINLNTTLVTTRWITLLFHCEDGWMVVGHVTALEVHGNDEVRVVVKHARCCRWCKGGIREQN